MADGMVRRGKSLTFVRKFCQGLAFVGPAFCMIACGLLTPNSADPVAVAAAPTALLVALLSVGFALGAWSRAGLYCNHQVRRAACMLCMLACFTSYVDYILPLSLALHYEPAYNLSTMNFTMNFTPVCCAGPVAQVCVRPAGHHQHSGRHPRRARRHLCRPAAGCHGQLAARALLPHRLLPALWRRGVHGHGEQRAPALELSPA